MTIPASAADLIVHFRQPLSLKKFEKTKKRDAFILFLSLEERESEFEITNDYVNNVSVALSHRSDFKMDSFSFGLNLSTTGVRN